MQHSGLREGSFEATENRFGTDSILEWLEVAPLGLCRDLRSSDPHFPLFNYALGA